MNRQSNQRHVARCNGQSLTSSSLLWLSAALAISILPLIPELAWWIAPLAALIVYWRFTGNSAHSVLKFIVVTLSIGALAISYAPGFSLQGFVSLLVLTACLKIIELTTSRDYRLLVLLGCFISACQLLFSSEILSFAYTLLCFVLLHYCSLSLLKSEQGRIGLGNIKKVFVIFLQALPIAIVLFIVVPRIGSLWKVPLNSEVAKTGVSDSLSAGDISRLNQDYSVAMRVTFESEEVPAKQDLYWRGVLLTDFDGSTWRRNLTSVISSPLNAGQKVSLAKEIEVSSQPKFSYQVMLEATGREWLYGLNTPSLNNSKITQLQDYSLLSNRPIVSRFSYDVDSYLKLIVSKQLSDRQRAVYTQLPSVEGQLISQIGNPKSVEYARNLKRRYADPEAFINALMQRYRQAFSYTLSPGKLSEINPIDDFLFNQQKGYCEHFASSTAFLLRAAGIPARIAAGYQGGQWSSDKKYLQITQADAHAWV